MFQKTQMEFKPVIYNKATQKIMTKEELENKENEVFTLPDLYIRKLRLIERVHTLRRSFVPRSNRLLPSSNLKDEREFSQWDYVLKEVRWMAHDFREERKFKIALAYHCSRRIMKQTKQENIYNQELVLYHKLVSHEMSEIVRNDFLSLSKEPKESELEKASMDIEATSVQNEGLLDLDLEINQKSSNHVPNNVTVTPVQPGGASNLKKTASMQISTFSITSNKVKKKGGNNPLKASQLPPPTIVKQQNLTDYMRKTVELFGLQLLDSCCSIDKSQVYENLAKLFKRFPKKSKHLKSNVPDIFSGSALITPFEEAKNSATIPPNPVVENSGQKKRKKTTGREEAARAGTGFVASELKKGADFLNFKKTKNPENFDEVLTLFYNEGKIGEGDYQKIFSNSIEMAGGSQFPKTWEELPTMRFHEMLFERGFRYSERTFDEEFERSNEENLWMLEGFMEGLGEKMDRRQLINCDNSTIRRILERDEISVSDLIACFPKINKNFLITYNAREREGGRNKFKLFKEYLPSNDSINFESHLSRKWPLIMHFLLDHYFNIYGNKWNLVSDALNINVLTRNCMMTDEVTETKWLSFLSKRNTVRIIDPQIKIFPPHHPTRPSSELVPAGPKPPEDPLQTKRKSIFTRMAQRKEKTNLEAEFEAYKEINAKFDRKEGKENPFSLYPSERVLTVFDILKNDIIREKQKEIFEMMEGPTKKQQCNPDTALNINRFMNYENFITENDSKLKASLVNVNPYVNSKRKRYISDKIIQNFVKLIVDSKHQQQMRQYTAPAPMPGGPPPNPPPQYMPIPPSYKMPIPPHALAQEQPPPNMPPSQNYSMHPSMNPHHLMNIRVSDPNYQNSHSRNSNYMGAPPNFNKAPMINNPRAPQPPTRMPSGEFMPPNTMNGNMTGGMTLRGPNMGPVNMANGAVNMANVNRSNVYQLNQINTVSNLKSEQLKIVKKPKT